MIKCSSIISGQRSIECLLSFLKAVTETTELFSLNIYLNTQLNMKKPKQWLFLEMLFSLRSVEKPHISSTGIDGL